MTFVDQPKPFRCAARVAACGLAPRYGSFLKYSQATAAKERFVPLM